MLFAYSAKSVSAQSVSVDGYNTAMLCEDAELTRGSEHLILLFCGGIITLPTRHLEQLATACLAFSKP
jgi:hypothetical protein